MIKNLENSYPLNSEEIKYSWCKQFKIEREKGLGNECVSIFGMWMVSSLALAYLPFTSISGNICFPMGEGSYLTPMAGSILSGIGIITSSIGLISGIYKKCTLFDTEFSPLTSEDGRISALKSEKCLSTTKIYSFASLLVINTIFIITFNLVCR